MSREKVGAERRLRKTAQASGLVQLFQILDKWSVKRINAAQVDGKHLPHVCETYEGWPVDPGPCSL